MLVCTKCGKIIVLNERETHYARCSSCGTSDITEAEKKRIKGEK